MIARRAFLAGMAAVMAAPRTTDAQATGRVAKIGVVNGASADASHPVRGLREGLREAGYIEGQNIVVEYRWANGQLERIPALVAELLAVNVDIIVAGNTAAAVAAKKASQRIPIVMVFVSDPDRRGLILSLAKPGGNVTGMTSFALEMTTKQLELLKEAFPNASRFAVLWNPVYEPSADHLRRAQAAAGLLRLQLQPVGASDANELDVAFAAMSHARAAAVLVVADPTFFLHGVRLAELAVKHRLPTMYGFREHVEFGGLMAYTADAVDLFRRAAYYVDKILKGTKPADLPIEQPTKFEFVINLKTAKSLGLTIPPSLLLRADQVIE